MRIGLIVIGDEILSGKRQDKHFAKVIELLRPYNFTLDWVHYLPDAKVAIVNFLKKTFDEDIVVLSTGGIGATPDDHTRLSVAEALSVPLIRNAEAAQLISERVRQLASEKQVANVAQFINMNSEQNKLRLLMADLPQGSELIPNPYNKIPGFYIKNHYFFPGFPIMAWPMIEWVLKEKYAGLIKDPVIEHSVEVQQINESQIIPLLRKIENQFPSVNVFSLPSIEEGRAVDSIEVGVKGPAHQAANAFEMLQQGLKILVENSKK